MQIILFVLATIWVLGVIILFAYSLALYLLLKRRVCTATLIQNNIYQSDQISSPFVCGFLKPRIILPIALGYDERDYIIRHEETHIKRRDYLVKPLWFLAVCIHWFNPLVWLSFYLMSRDMEMRCDEAVIREMGENIKVDYSSSLLTLSVAHKFLPGNPLAFGETGIKTRVKNVLNYKRPAFWVIAVAVVAVISATVVLAVNPIETKTKQSLNGVISQNNTYYVGNNSKVKNGSASVDLTFLDACVGIAILSENANQYHKSDFAAESHVTLKTVENGNMTTVYTMALYQEYEFSGGGFTNTGGNHMPVSITFEKNMAGQYRLIEYWIPKDGSYYAPSIKENFPTDIYEDALDTQKYIMSQIQSCYEQAVSYGKVDANVVIKKLFETITATPAQASNPRAYIDAHPIEYRELLYYGKHTLLYCFRLFEQGEQTDLNGHIMAAACRNILQDEDIRLLADTGQIWYDTFKSNAENLRNKNGDDYMKNHMPWSYLLLQTLESVKK